MCVSIPKWDDQGIIPPTNPTLVTSAPRSPYQVSLRDVVSRFGLSPERLEILDGFLHYRAQLHAVGLIDGFQWLDGSFLENIEITGHRPPNDIDVVTFYRLPQGLTQQSLGLQNPNLFPMTKDAHNQLKITFNVDAYLVCLDNSSRVLVEQSIYWYSVWSHRRDYLWKGYVQVDLSPQDDTAALALLAALSGPGGRP